LLANSKAGQNLERAANRRYDGQIDRQPWSFDEFFDAVMKPVTLN
jgi:hypothetical protein